MLNFTTTTTTTTINNNNNRKSWEGQKAKTKTVLLAQPEILNLHIKKKKGPRADSEY